MYFYWWKNKTNIQLEQSFYLLSMAVVCLLQRLLLDELKESNFLIQSDWNILGLITIAFKYPLDVRNIGMSKLNSNIGKFENLLSFWLKMTFFRKCNWEHLCEILLNLGHLLREILWQPEYWPNIWSATCDFEQCGILSSVDSDEPVQPPLQMILCNLHSKWISVSSLGVIEYSSD